MVIQIQQHFKNCVDITVKFISKYFQLIILLIYYQLLIKKTDYQTENNNFFLTNVKDDLKPESVNKKTLNIEKKNNCTKPKRENKIMMQLTGG